MSVIKFVIIKNPLVLDARQFEERDFEAHKSLHSYMGELKGEWVISLNGKILEQDNLDKIFPLPNDVIAIAPMLRGGGEDDGKSIVRLVAMVALTYFTAGMGANGFWATGLEGVGLVAAQTAIAVGGTLLINALLPVKPPEVSENERRITYGIDGPKNTSEEGLPVPLVYGEHRVAGNVIGNFTELQGQTQYLNMLINLGEGVMSAVDLSSILVNEQPIEDIGEKPKIEVAFGNDGQRALSSFADQISSTPVTINPELKDPNVWTNFVTEVGNESSGITLNFVTSIYRLNKKNKDEWNYVDIQAQIRPYGSTDDDWATITSGVPYKYASKGWIFDLIETPTETYRYDPKGKKVTKQKLGTQILERGNAGTGGPSKKTSYRSPNVYDHETGKYEYFFMHRDDLPENYIYGIQFHPKAPSAYFDYYLVHLDPSFGHPSGTRDPRGSLDKWQNIEIGLSPVMMHDSEVREFEYGNLIVDGKVVGKYHDFHPYNDLVLDRNGGELQAGAFAGWHGIPLIGNNSSSATRFSIKSAALTPQRYEIRVRRLTKSRESNRYGDRVQFAEVSEVKYNDLAYNYSALMGLTIKVTDQLENIPKITSLHKGKVIRVWDDEKRRWVPSCKPPAEQSALIKYYSLTERELETHPPLTEEQLSESSASSSGNIIPNVANLRRPAHTIAADSNKYDENGFFDHNNPAWISWDLMIEGGIQPERLDFAQFKHWADWCREKNLTFNGVIDQKESLWDAIALVFRVGRATPIRTGTRYGVSIEKPKSPVMMFGQDNIIKDTFSTSWMSIEDRANEIELTYFDKNLDYKQNIIKVYDKSTLETSPEAIPTSAKLIGITDEEQAIREAIYMLNTNKLVQTVSFQAPVESISCTLGDVVIVQHNMMEWGHAGKVKQVISKVPSDSSSGEFSYNVKLDSEIDFSESDGWKILLKSDVKLMGQYQVKERYGNYVLLEGFNLTLDQAKRCMIDGVDVKISDTFSNNSNNGIVVDEPERFAIGATVDIFNIDVIESVPLNAPSGKTDTVQFNTEADVSKYSSFMIGYENFESRKFTVRSITFSGSELTRKLTLLEYDERVFDDSTSDFTINTTLPDRALQQVEDIAVGEDTVPDSVDINKVRVTVAWNHSNPLYDKANVYVQINDRERLYLGGKVSQASIAALNGDDIIFTITPISFSGKEGATTELTHKVGDLTDSETILTPISPTVNQASGGNSISWSYSSEASENNLIAKTDIYFMKSEDLIRTDDGLIPIRDVVSFEGISQDAIESAVTFADSSKSTNYLHQVNDTGEGERYWYFVRGVSKTDVESPVIYAGNSAPVNSASYYTSTVYAVSDEAPQRPNGGDYSSPIPNSPAATWFKDVPNIDANSNDSVWVSNRRLCNFPSLSDESWSLPSKLSTTGKTLFTWTAFASDKNGSDFSFSQTPSVHKFIGRAYNKESSSPSTNHKEYEWAVIVTEQDFLSDTDRKAIENLSKGLFPDGSSIASEEELNDEISEKVEEAIGGITSKPMAPTITKLTENEDGTVSALVTPNSSSEKVTRYELWKSHDNALYELVKTKPTEDVSSVINFIDDTVESKSRIYYRAFSVNLDTYSEPSDLSINLVKKVPDPSNLIVVSETFSFIISWDLPGHPQLGGIELFTQALESDSGFNESRAKSIYKGMSSSFAYDVPIDDLGKYHQFWVKSYEK